jgi:hypothetical protein
VTGRIWCAQEKKVELRDAATLAVIADHAKITSVVGSSLADSNPSIHLESGALMLHTSDDRDVFVDAALTVRPRGKSAGDWFHLEPRSARSTAQRPESANVYAALVGKPPVLVGTDTKTLRELYRYDGTFTK